MNQQRPVSGADRGRRGRLPPRFRQVLRRLLVLANRGSPRPVFVREACGVMAEFSDCDAVEIRVDERGKGTRCRASLDEAGALLFDCASPAAAAAPPADDAAAALLDSMLRGRVAGVAPFATRSGSFWTNDTARPLLLRDKGERTLEPRTVVLGGDYPSLAIFPIPVDDHCTGVLFMGARRREFFTRDDILFYEGVAETLGAALAHQGAQWALRERVKELTCLYGIAQVAQSPAVLLDSLLPQVVELLPPGWQYPELTQARITHDGRAFATAGFRGGEHRQVADIVIRGRKRGAVEVEYTEAMPEFDEGPFLREERSLINEIARQLALIIEQCEADAEKAGLQEQLRHADRLATIGKLAAGAAHELNEPLASILGFAQLMTKHSGFPAAAERDAEKIAAAAVYAREIVQKLLIFARQMPSRKTVVNLNKLIRDGLFFWESRCVKEGIRISYRLDADLPDVTADPAQVQQVLVNLVVNAMQAMPDGGMLLVETRAAGDRVIMAVEDTGVGMSRDVQAHIFVPFFTTKDVGQGTGLGLSVVHGIVAAHGGEITVDSEIGRGSRFEVRLPVSSQAAASAEGAPG